MTAQTELRALMRVIDARDKLAETRGNLDRATQRFHSAIRAVPDSVSVREIAERAGVSFQQVAKIRSER